MYNSNLLNSGVSNHWGWSCPCVCVVGFVSLSGLLWFAGDGLSAGGKEQRHRASHGLSPEPCNSQPYYGESHNYYSPESPQ